MSGGEGLRSADGSDLRVRVKSCCIASLEEAHLAVECGVDALGLVSSMPSGPGVIEEQIIAEVAAWSGPEVRTFLLTCLCDPEALAAQHARCRTTTIQLCDYLDIRCGGGSAEDAAETHRQSDAEAGPNPAAYSRLRELLPAGVELVQVIHVLDEADVDRAVATAPHVDAILLDSGNPTLATKELGGTGRRHDWALSRRIRDAVAPTRVWLAGGLTPQNARDAIAQVAPYGLDVCSGIRTEGRLDGAKLREFITAVRKAAGEGP